MSILKFKGDGGNKLRHCSTTVPPAHYNSRGILCLNARVMRAAGLILLMMVAAPLSARQNTLQNCPLPPVLGVTPPGANIFSEQQESDLGDVMAERVSQTITILHD